MERIGSIGEQRAKVPLLAKLLSVIIAAAILFAFFAVRFHALAKTLGENELSVFFHPS